MSDIHSQTQAFSRWREARLQAMFRKEDVASLRFLAWLRSGTLEIGRAHV